MSADANDPAASGQSSDQCAFDALAREVLRTRCALLSKRSRDLQAHEGRRTLVVWSKWHMDVPRPFVKTGCRPEGWAIPPGCGGPFRSWGFPIGSKAPSGANASPRCLGTRGTRRSSRSAWRTPRQKQKKKKNAGGANPPEFVLHAAGTAADANCRPADPRKPACLSDRTPAGPTASASPPHRAGPASTRPAAPCRC